MLEPCEDLEFLLRKFQRDVCSVMGVPDDIAGVQQKGGVETARKTIATGRVFTTNMQDLCRHLGLLLSSVYRHIYGKDNAEFVMIPMPRLELESIADLKVLSEIGAINPDMSLQISQIVLGEDIENKRKRMRLQAESEQQQQQNKQFMLSQGDVQSIKGKPQQQQSAEKDKQDPKKRPPPPGGPKKAGST